jgi:hypothetical protein
MINLLISSRPSSPSTPTVPISNGKFPWTASKTGKSSAAVINSSGQLVRVLWVARDTAKGSYVETWDGKDELGAAVTTGTYNVIIKHHNLSAAVKGIIGNNSVDSTGSGVWRGFQFIHEMAFTSSFGYYALGYNEGWSSIGKFSISQPLRKIPILETRQTNAVVHYVCTDGNYVFWSAYDPAIPNKSFVFATKCSDDTEVPFVGQATNTQVFNSDGRVYKAINIINAVSSKINGMAVSSTCLLVCRENGTVTAINRTTGAVMATNSIAGCGKIATDGGTNVYIQIGTEVKLYTVNSGGVLTFSSTIITGLTAPLDLKQASGTLSIIDNSVVKHFNTSGTQTGTLGSGASYVTDPNVTDNKFYFKVSDGFKPFISYQADGAIWVGDVGNSRVQKFSSGTYVSNIRFISHNYNVNVEATLGNRTFIDWLEFNTTDLSSPGNCPLVRNYEPSAPAGYSSFTWHRLEWPLLFSNGRTYAWIKHEQPPTPTNLPKLFEIPTDGPLRLADTLNLPAHSVFTVDPTNYTFRLHKKVSGNVVVEERTLNGFTSNNPTWSSPTTILTMPIRDNEPVESDIEKIPQKTSGGYLIMYRKGINDEPNNYHLGGVKAGDTNYRWLSERTHGMTYSGDWITGRFDDANEVWNPGGNVFVIGSHVYDVYKGEHWKSSQTNFWTHHTEEGIPLYGFGKWKTQDFSHEAMAEVAGNVQSGGVILRGGKHYIIHNDESIHGGAMVWEISGLDTIETIPVTVKTPDAPAEPPTLSDSEWISGDQLDRLLVRGAGTGNFIAKSDVKTNSPGIFSTMVAAANSLVNNNALDKYNGPNYTDYIQPFATPENGSLGCATLWAAILSKIHPDSAKRTAYKAAAKASLLLFLANPINTFPEWDTATTGGPWRKGVLGDLNPLFIYYQYVIKFIKAYMLLIDEFSGGQQTSFSTLFQKSGEFGAKEVNSDMLAMITNRNPSSNWHATGYTLSSTADDNGYRIYDNGPYASIISLYLNNRRAEILYASLLCGILTGDHFMIKSAYVFYKEWVKYGLYPVGTNVFAGEMERGRNSSFRQHGISYPAVMLYLMGSIAESMERFIKDNPDYADDYPSLFAYTTSEGLAGSVGGPKNFYKVLKTTLGMFNGDVKVYYGGTLLNGYVASPLWEFTEDTTLAAKMNLYYKDDYLKKSYLRAHPGSRPYPTGGNGSGAYKPYAGPAGDGPYLFLNSNLEGLVNPY